MVHVKYFSTSILSHFLKSVIHFLPFIQPIQNLPCSIFYLSVIHPKTQLTLQQLGFTQSSCLRTWVLQWMMRCTCIEFASRPGLMVTGSFSNTNAPNKLDLCLPAYQNSTFNAWSENYQQPGLLRSLVAQLWRAAPRNKI